MDFSAVAHNAAGASASLHLEAAASPEDATLAGEATVVVIVPSRGREGHLKKFKDYWRWFAAKGNEPQKVKRWEIIVTEQLDALIFNRGWTFNVGWPSSRP